MLKKLSLLAVLGAALCVAGCKKKDDESKNEAPAKTEPATADKKEVKKEEPVAAKADDSKDPHAAEGLGSLSPDDVEKLLAEKKAHCFDANGKETRAKFGTVPGAKLLASYKDYDLGVLPEDKAAKLVFFCSNTQCGAAPKAAERALAAGYKDVNTMPVGIMGWKDAGKKTQAIN